MSFPLRTIGHKGLVDPAVEHQKLIVIRCRNPRMHLVAVDGKIAPASNIGTSLPEGIDTCTVIAAVDGIDDDIPFDGPAANRFVAHRSLIACKGRNLTNISR